MPEITTGNGNGRTRVRTSRSKDETRRGVSDVMQRERERTQFNPEEEAERREQIKQQMLERSAERATASIAKAKLDASKTLSELEAELTNRFGELGLIKQAIDVANEELQELNDKGMVLAATKDLITDFQTKANELARSHEEFKLKLRMEQENLQREHTRQQEQNEYQWSLAQKERKARWEDEDRLRQRKIAEEDEQRNKAFQEREAALAARETEVQELRTKVAEFPELLKKEVARETSIVGNTVKRDYETKIQVLTTEHNAALKVAGNENSLLKSDNERLQREILTLRNDLHTANSKVQEIATTAMHASSGKQALDEVRAIAQTQASAPKK